MINFQGRHQGRPEDPREEQAPPAGQGSLQGGQEEPHQGAHEERAPSGEQVNWFWALMRGTVLYWYNFAI